MKVIVLKRWKGGQGFATPQTGHERKSRTELQRNHKI